MTEEAVTIGEHGLLTGESLNALQHAGAISVYNTLQQNNWEYPVFEGIHHFLLITTDVLVY